MCLVTNNRKGFIADRNICVVKEVFKRGIYLTPYRGAEVTLDNYLIPDKAIPSIQKHQRKYYTIEGGVIHSYAMNNNHMYYNPSFIAIIPKGCRYWISKDNDDICSEVLFITSINNYGISYLRHTQEALNDPNSYLYKRYNPLLKTYKRSIFRKIIYTLFKLL